MVEDLDTKIKAFMLKKGGATIPEIQVEFNLEYRDVAPVIQRLLEEHFMRLSDGLVYVVNDTSGLRYDIKQRHYKDRR